MYKWQRKALIGRWLVPPVRDLPPKEWWEPSKVSWYSSLNPKEKEVTWLTPQSPQLELEVPTPEHNVLEKLICWGVLRGTLRISGKPEAF